MDNFSFPENFTDLPVYTLSHKEKQTIHQSILAQLTAHHTNRCQAYKNLITSPFAKLWSKNLTVSEQLAQDELLPLAVNLFKDLELKSVTEESIHKTLYSSGTSGKPSKIFLDQESARLQTIVLIKTLQHWLGKARLPMLVVDSPNVLAGKLANTARAAAIRGFATFSRKIVYALNDDYSINYPALNNFFRENAHVPTLMFGFTFMVWQHFISQLAAQGHQFLSDNITLFHGGGWKKLAHLAVDSHTFKRSCQTVFPGAEVHDYYGMVEQTGTIHVACQHGYFHPTIWSDIVIRRPWDLSIAQHGETGLIQVNSLIATSYPGHSLLTEDLGTIVGEDDCPCGLKGKYFTVKGRVPAAEKRGCSDAV